MFLASMVQFGSETDGLDHFKWNTHTKKKTALAISQLKRREEICKKIKVNELGFQEVKKACLPIF